MDDISLKTGMDRSAGPLLSDLAEASESLYSGESAADERKTGILFHI